MHLPKLLLLIYFGLVQSILCSSGDDEISQFCKNNNITASELEDEAAVVGVSSKMLIKMMSSEHFSASEELGYKNISRDLLDGENQNSSILTGYEDILGFVQSSSIIYSGDMVKNTTEERSKNATDMSDKLLKMDTQTLKLGEHTLFSDGEEKSQVGETKSNITEPTPEPKPETRKENDKYKIIFVKRSPKKSAIYGSSEGKLRAKGDIGKRYYIINSNGEKEEYEVVEHRPRLNREKRVKLISRPRKIRIIERQIQPLIIARPNNAQLRAPMQAPYMPGYHGHVVPPQPSPYLPPSPPQAAPQAPPPKPQTRDMSELDDMSTNDNYRYNDKNSFIGPMTISIIVVILIIICIIGGFCFCGATANRNTECMPLLPPRPHNIPPQPYNSRAPIIPPNPNHQMQPPQGRQVYGYAIIPNVR
ncbi:putative signal peptide-containing protein [Cryptosporidium canis]|uniref:Signal peptide-containing protein n=1 Tax=Cryptosporidium canis TaxID=195482 RepID=A0ABQ8PC83_9CRYT|nr:putative signal peptide-containing protein [Cryptosporidium canis]